MTRDYIQPTPVSTTTETFNNRLHIRGTLPVHYGSLPPCLNQKLIIGIGGAEIGDINTVISYDWHKMSSIGRVRSRRPSLVEWTQHMVNLFFEV
ncbi:hypothetical protein LOAG_01483 [Loa loa]|uniref:Uncharacterized protein n=1 Tax=Loa loa TaxID=7209 RepID=A0A1I7VQK2_LOALO|nr:hypothetical protein LOAG_01483 [Loa loa]EFO27000.2 hypothetical protein LOAG_01483 [Loa loa]